MRAGQWGGQREGGFTHAQVQAVNTYRLTPRSLAYPLCGLGNKCILVTLRSIPSDVIAGHGDSVHPAVSPRLCWSWYHKAGQLWSSKSSGGVGLFSTLSSCPLPPEQMSSGGPRPQASKQS